MSTSIPIAEQLCNRSVPYTIRPARASDSRFIYELAMDPRIRSMSTRSEEFTWEEHSEWWERRFTDRSTTRIWVMEVGDIPVGQVRYGRVPEPWEPPVGWSVGQRAGLLSALGSQAEISISVVPSQQKRGYATTLLQETMPLARELLGVDTLVALVLRHNYASRRLFWRAGFRFVGAECRMGKTHARYEI